MVLISFASRIHVSTSVTEISSGLLPRRSDHDCHVKAISKLTGCHFYTTNRVRSGVWILTGLFVPSEQLKQRDKINNKYSPEIKLKKFF